MTPPKPSVTREDDIEWVRQALDYCIATGKPPTFAMKDAFERGLVAHREAAVRQERERIEREMNREVEHHRVTSDCDASCIPEDPFVLHEDAVRIVRADHAKGAE